jgi:ABC-2 type transport system permease protein
MTALPFAILGIFVGFMVNAETAYPVVTALMFVLGYFGGLFNPVSHMPRVLQTAARFLPSFHQTSIGLALLDGRGFGLEDALVLVAYAVVLGGAIVWKHRVEEARGLA